MSSLSSTSTEPHEEAVTSFVHSVRKYELKDQMYPLVEHMDYVHEFAASTTVLQHVISTNAFDFKKYVPYMLEKGKMSLFPEFIRYFMKAFMMKSNENMAYCVYDAETFRGLFRGTKEEVVSAVKAVEMDFSTTLFRCLSPALQESYRGWTLTRSILKTSFHAEIMDENEEMSVAIRKEELRSLAKEGHVVPYVEFLMAFEHGEQFIWSEVAAIVSGFTHNDKQIKFASKKLAHWRKVTKGLLKSRINDFLSDLKDEGIVANTETQSMSNEKRRKIDSEDPEGWEHDKEKTNLAATPTVRKDGSSWIPQDQWVELQEEKRKAREVNQDVSDASSQLVTAKS
ncbi:hypothetical protein OXX79_002736 [Metschnikowia pulcherrima]